MIAADKELSEREPEPPRKIDPRVDRDLETICLKCLEKDPERRYGSAEALAEDQECYLDNKPIRARPVQAWERAWKWARRRRSLAAVYGLGLLTFTLGGLGSGATWLWQRAETAYNQAESALPQEQQARAGEAEARRQLAVALYLHKVQLAHHALLDGDLLRAQQRLDECTPELRHWEWHYVHHLCHGELLTLQGHMELAATLIYSPDGRRLVSNGEQAVHVWDLAENREILTLGADQGTTLIVSRDRQQFASCHPGGNARDGRIGNSEIKMGDLATGKERFTFRLPSSCFVNPVFNPNGKHLAACSGVVEAQTTRTLRGEIQVWDLATGQERRTLKIEGACFASVAFSPDGKCLAADSYVRTFRRAPIVPRELKVWDLETGQDILTLPSPRVGDGYAFSPDGRQLAAAECKGTVKLWNAPSLPAQPPCDPLLDASIQRD
jgi:hypothetical protein